MIVRNISRGAAVVLYIWLKDMVMYFLKQSNAKLSSMKFDFPF